MFFIAPFLVFMAIIFFIPLALIFVTSVVPEDGGATTFEFFQTFFTGGLYLRVLTTTIEISLIGAAFTLIFAYPIAYYLALQPARKRMYLSLLVLLPFYTSILVKSFAFTIILGFQGVVNWFLRIFMGPEFAVQLLYNRIGVMIGIVHDMLPFIVFPILINLLAQNPALHKAAEIMGASRMRIFWQVTLPLSIPAIMTGLLLVIVRVMGQFVTPALLGGRQDLMLANLVSFHISEVLDWNMAAVISIILFCISSLFLFILSRVRGAQLFGKEA
ncbi:MAG: ABC transporter permease [Pseudomonadota bacterium]